MKREYIYYTSDESFDYNGPFGTETYFQRGTHGFSLDFDEDDNPILQSLEGFGDFYDVEYCKTKESFKEYLKKNMKHLKYEPDTTPEEEFKQLLKQIKKEVKNGNKCIS